MRIPYLREARQFFGDSSSFFSRDDDDDDDDDREGVSTRVSVVYVTASKTFDGPAVYITQVASSTSEEEEPNTDPTPTPNMQTTRSEAAKTTQSPRTSRSTTAAPQTTSTRERSSSSDVETSSDRQTTTVSSAASHFVGTPLSNSATTGSASSTIDPLAAGAASSSTATASPEQKSSSSDSGMSSGGKAGLAIGIILGLALIAGLVFFLYRRKKQANDEHERLDDEKGQHIINDFPMTNGGAVAAAAIPRPRQNVNSMAPRLSLRPMTGLFGMGANRRSGGNMLDIPETGPAAGTTMAGGAAGARGLRQPGATAAAPRNTSAWEKMGQRDHANDPTNPFGNHAETVAHSPPATAPVSAFATAPGSPSRTDFPSDAAPAAAAGATAGAIAAATAAASKDAPKDDPAVPKPLSIKSAKSAANGPPSPALTDATTGDVPAALVAGGAAAAGGAAPAGPAGPNNVHRVQMDFKPSMDDELELRAGQLVRLLHAYDDGWALCVRMDRSHQGVVPRTCLSKHPVKPRPPPNPNAPRGPGPRGSPPRGPANGPFANPNGRNSPGPGARPSGPPTGRSSPGPSSPGFPPAPFGNQPRPSSPMGPAGRSRSGSVPRSMSPGPMGTKRMSPPAQKRRSNSMSNVMAGNGAPGSKRNSPPGLSPLGQSQLPVPVRKPVPGQGR